MAKGFGLTLVAAFFVASFATAAEKDLKTYGFADLTADQQKSIKAGERVVLTREVRNAPWPEVLIFQTVNATPEEGAAVFADFELAKDYLTTIKESKIFKKVDARTFQVDYVLDLPVPVADEDYRVEDRVSRYNDNRAYRVDWSFLRARSTKDILGHIRFESLDSQRTLMIYYYFVVPGNVLAGSFKERALQEVKTTAQQTVEQIEKERKSDQALLNEQVEALRAMFQ